MPQQHITCKREGDAHVLCFPSAVKHTHRGLPLKEKAEGGGEPKAEKGLLHLSQAQQRPLGVSVTRQTLPHLGAGQSLMLGAYSTWALSHIF